MLSVVLSLMQVLAAVVRVHLTRDTGLVQASLHNAVRFSLFSLGPRRRVRIGLSSILTRTRRVATGGPSGANAEVNCNDGIIESKAGGVVAKAPCETPPPPAPTPKAAPAPPPAPAPKAAPAPAPKAELPKSGGASSTSLLALGAGTLLVAGGLMARKVVR